VAAQVTFGDYARAHLARQPWRRSTGDVAANALLHHALGVFGERPLASIRKADVQAFVSGLDLAPSTVRTVYQHLSGLLSSAVEDRLLVLNPARGVRLPRAEGGEIVPPSAEEVDALCEAAPAWFRSAIVLGAGLGLRQGEASGLTADRIDWLGERSVRIDRQWSSRRSPHGFAPPKSASSYRSIPAAESVLAELGRVVRRKNPSGFVLHEGDPDNPVGHHRFGHVWRQTVRRAGAEKGLRFHDLRHRFASVLISDGCSVVAVQRAMGHSSAAITLNLYGHLMPTDSDRIRTAIDRASRRAEDSLRTADAPS
jgi:integrase